MEAANLWINYNFVVLCTIVILFTFLIQSHNIGRSIRVHFYILCFLLVLESVSATIEELFDASAQYSIPVRMAMSSIGYAARPGMLFVILLIMLRDYRPRLRVLMSLPLALEIILLIINLPTKFMYQISYDEEHSSWWNPTGIVHYYLYMVLFIYMAIIAVTAITNYHKNHTESVVVFIALGILICNYILETQISGMTVTVRETATSMAIIIYYFYFSSQGHADELQEAELNHEKAEREATERMLKQVIETLSSTIDAKDKYTQGHSARVADYSLAIAERSGFSPTECRQIYYAGLLHDIGKIAIPEYIINKAGKLNDEEYNIIKTHPLRGKETLGKLKDMPFLVLGAQYHHERFDGKGYPKGLEGKNIPAVGRIIAVADAYDAMTSKRSYRSPLPQALAREQILRGMGTQFDPKYAEIMLDMIDADVDYNMCEKPIQKDSESGKLHCSDWWAAHSEGIRITNNPLTVRFGSRTDANADEHSSVPALILYDSDDGQLGISENEPGKNDFREYAVVRADTYTRKADAQVLKSSGGETFTSFDWEKWFRDHKTGTDVTVHAVRFENMLSVSIESAGLTVSTQIALNDSYSWSYLAITGEHCTIGIPEFYYNEETVQEGDIPQLGTKPVMTEDPAGDLPNLECDGWNPNRTAGILLTEKPVTVTYRARTYPRAKRIWHSSYFSLFRSEDGQIGGPGYQEYYTLRSDGEGRRADDSVLPEVRTEKGEGFIGWNEWFERNKAGVDCSITAHKKDNKIFFNSKNSGVTLSGYVILPDDTKGAAYLALCGELCSITNIHVKTEA